MRNATGLSIFTATELLAADTRPRRDLLAPLLASDSAALVYGPAGIGKSFLALAMAWAVASGGSFLGWRAPRRHRVTYIDGDLGAAELRERLALFGPPPPGLVVCAHDPATGPFLDLSDNADQARLMRVWRDPELAVLDAPSSLAALRGGDGKRWQRLQHFLQHQRKHERAMLLVDHANKDGALRGSTQREDALDLVIALRRPEAGAPGGHARFEIHVEKARRHGAAPLVPMLAALETDVGGRAQWRWGPADGGRVERAAGLINRGLTAREASAALGISLRSLFRLKASARANGLLTERGSLP